MMTLGYLKLHVRLVDGVLKVYAGDYEVSNVHEVEIHKGVACSYQISVRAMVNEIEEANEFRPTMTSSSYTYTGQPPIDQVLSRLTRELSKGDAR